MPSAPKKMALLLQTPTRRSGRSRLSDERGPMSPLTPLTPLTPSLGTPSTPPGNETEFDAAERGRAGLTGSSPAATRRAGSQREAARTNKKKVVSWFQKRFGRLSVEVKSNATIQQAKARKSSYAAM